jgi:serine/threonine-protein kinase
VSEGVAQGVRLLAGRYQVGDLIGRGGMADVHAGVDARLGRKVAIKLLKPSLATDPAFRSRFRREAQDAAKMAHPTIVRIFDAGEETIITSAGVEAQLPFIIMEYVDGKLLKDIIAGGPLDPHQASGIANQILTALEYSHRAGLVHRDIKPGNVMITSTGQVKVMDFGIARAISETSSTIAESSAIVGTAQYFSPEQARGETVDARTDLYSTGIVLFEMLTGRAPFVGENPVAVAYQHVNQQAVRPSAINPRVSPALDAVVLRAISKDRFERFQSAADFRAELDAADSGTTVIKRPVPVAEFNATLFGVNPNATSGSEATMRQLTVDDQTRGSRSSQSRPPVAWIWGGIAIMAVIVVAVLYWTLNLTMNPIAIGQSTVSVSDVTGQTWEDGSAALTDQNLMPTQLLETNNDIEAGTILRTVPIAGTNVEPETEVRVYVSSGAKHDAVPNVVGKELAEATEILVAAGFTVTTEATTGHSPSVEAGVVTATTPAAGADTQAGSDVSLMISDGKVSVPSVIDQPISDASKMLSGSEYQLTVTETPDFSCYGNAVASQSETGDLDQHSDIELVYCAGSSPPPVVPPVEPTAPAQG